METLVINIEQTGTVSSLHMDTFDLGFLGNKSVKRQTEIVFNQDSQLWDIHYQREKEGSLASPVIGCFTGYEKAREFEVKWVNFCRLNRINPESLDGIKVASYLRNGAFYGEMGNYLHLQQ